MKLIKTLATAVAFLASASLASALDTKPPEYKPLTNLIGQAFKNVAKKDGSIVRCIVFPYDRQGDSEIDLLEFRVLKTTKEGYQTWEEHPYILFVDDDFDGYADRLFIDHGKVRDGVFDDVQDLKNSNISMEEIYSR